MKFLLIACLGLVSAVVAYPAAAASFEPGLGFRLFVQDQRPRPEPQREADRLPPQRDTRPPGQADRGRMSPAMSPGMSPDERRQLRRDIQDAGKDLYHRDRPPPQRSGRK